MAGSLAARWSTRQLAETTSPSRRAVLVRRIRWLVAATISYNLVEAVVAIAAGTAASSTALVSFGLDSLIEVSSAAAVAWQFAAADHEARERRERVALRAIALSFFALAGYVTVGAARTLVGAGEARPSGVGLALAAVSLLVLPALSYAQRRAGRQLGSATAVADSKQTLLCTWLSAVLLVGLATDTLLGWWWADPLAALAIGALAVREGVRAWRGHACCVPDLAAGLAADAAASPAADGCSDGCPCTTEAPAASRAEPG